MGRWVSPLVVEEVAPGSGEALPDWRLTAVLGFFSDLAGMLEVPIGFVTNFCSVPRVPFAMLLFAAIGNRSGTLHDWLYCSRFDRSICDSILYEALLADGVPKWKAWAMYQAVRLFGASHYQGTGSND